MDGLLIKREDDVSEGVPRSAAVEAQLSVLQQRVLELQTTQRQLIEEIAALRQGQTAQTDVLAKLERELRRGRLVRRV
jgi:hypothetical protein